jgi:hypothetical protein
MPKVTNQGTNGVSVRLTDGSWHTVRVGAEESISIDRKDEYNKNLIRFGAISVDGESGAPSEPVNQSGTGSRRGGAKRASKGGRRGRKAEQASEDQAAGDSES